MLIDWFTVIAQIINFLILVYLLKRFLYKPILNAIDERERSIAAQLEDAQKQKAEADGQRTQYENKSRELDQQRETLLKEARTNAESERNRLLTNARQEYENLRKKLQESLSIEEAHLSHELKWQTRQEVFDTARKVLSDLADTSLEGQIVAVFLRKINDLPDDAAGQLREKFQAGNGLLVRSAFELSVKQQELVQQAIAKKIGADGPVQFRAVPDEVSGIELSAGGFKVSWTIAAYLESLEKRVAALASDSPERLPTPTTLEYGK